MTLREFVHWIVATLGLSETLVLLLVGLVWTFYGVWTRYRKPPRGVQRWGIWIPLAVCVYEVFRGLRQHWRFYRMMVAANAFNEAQATLFWESTRWGAAKLLLVGIIGTAFLYFSLRRQGPYLLDSVHGSQGDQLAKDTED